jgi:hypothetical protein
MHGMANEAPARTGTRPPPWAAILLYVVVLALLAIPIASVVVPPLVDYPNHLARMHILATYANSPALQANYVVAWKLSPYLAMDVIIPQLAHVMSIYTAGRVFLYLCLLLFVTGTLAVYAVLDRRFSAWPAASALFAYSYVTSLGFVNYLFGVGIWLLAFAGWIVVSRRAISWRIVAGTLLSLAVFFCHFFAFFGYMLCVGAYEFGIWLETSGRRPATLLSRGVVAFCPFIPALTLFAIASQGQQGGITWYGAPLDKVIAVFSPMLFQATPYSVGILILLYFPLRKGLLGNLHLVPVMRVPLLAVGIAAIAMPHVLAGVWGVDFRLPVVWLFLLIASCSWSATSARASIAVSGFMLALLTVNVAMIVWAWQPIGRQFDEFRAALPAIPAGAAVIVFWDEAGMDPLMLHQPFAIYRHLGTLAVVERDAYVPFLFMNPMMPVATAPGRRNIDASVGYPIGLGQLTEAMDPVKSPAAFDGSDAMGEIDYLENWPAHFDYAVEFNFGARPALPPLLDRVASGSFFNIYRIER